MITRLSAAWFGLFLGLIWPASAPAELAPALVQRGKLATALVEIRAGKDIAFGSAFCIDRSGLFVTNAHVVEAAATNGVVKLVLHIGEKTQRVAQARVVRSSDELDLAVLKIDADLGLTPLELGKEDGLGETLAVTSFGYPFGKALAVTRDGYPGVSVNSSRITSLRKVEGKLVLIQIDGLLNPGNSGGPVLDPEGKVIGVVAAGVLGAGINFAIPVGRLADYLTSPIVRLDAPAIAYVDRSRPLNCTVEVAPANPGGRLPPDLAVTVTVVGGSAAPRKVIARAAGEGRFKATVVPVPRDPGRRVMLKVLIGDRSVQGTILDRDLKINGKTIALGDLLSLSSGPPPRVTAADGRIANGSIQGLGKARLQPAQGREVAIDLEQATSITVQSVEQAPAVGPIVAIVEVRQGAKVVAALQKRLEIKEAAAAMAARRPQQQRSFTFEAESLKVLNNGGDPASAQEMGGFQGTWSEGRQLFWKCSASGRSLLIEIPVAGPGVFDVRAAFTTSHDYGIAALTLNGKSLARVLDLYSPSTARLGPVQLNRVELNPDRSQVLNVTMVFKNPMSTSYMFGLDWIQLVRVDGE